MMVHVWDRTAWSPFVQLQALKYERRIQELEVSAGASSGEAVTNGWAAGH